MVEESIRINKTQVNLFDIPIKLENTENEVEIFIQSIKDTGTAFKIAIEFFISESKQPNSLKLSYNKKKLNAYKSIFVGWSYLMQYHTSELQDNSFKNKAIQYLKSAIKNDAKSCLPHYLLGSEPLNYICHPNLLIQMYSAVNKYKDASAEFYALIFENEKDKVKALKILEEGLDKFSTNLILNYYMSNLLIEKKDYSNALKCLEKAELKDIKNIYVWKYYTKYFYNRFLCHIKLKNFITEFDLLKKAKDIDSNEILLFKGILRFNQGNFKESAKFFLECIKNDTGSVVGYCAHFYLLNCYINLKDIAFIEEAVKNLPEKIISCYNNYFGFSFLETAERSLRKIIDLELSESLKAKAIGLLASIIIFEKINTGNDKYKKQNLNESEIKLFIEAEKLIQKAVSYHPKSSFFQTVNSNILTLKEKYQECISDYLEKHREDETVIHELKLEQPRKLFYYDYTSDKKQLLKKYHHESPGLKIMLYLLDNQNTVITIEKIKKISGKKKIKSLRQVVRDLGFEEPIKDLFFETSDNTLEFRATVKNKDLK